MDKGIYKLPVKYEMSDIDIFGYKGVELPYNIPVIVQQISCYDWFYIYLPMMSKMVEYFNRILPNITLLKDFKNDTNVDIFKDKFIVSLQDVRLRNYLIVMFKKLKFIDCRINHFLKNILIDQLCEMFLITYLFNTEGLKKKLKFLIEKAYTAKKTISETSSSNVKRMVGSMKVVDKITRQKKS